MIFPAPPQTARYARAAETPPMTFALEFPSVFYHLAGQADVICVASTAYWEDIITVRRHVLIGGLDVYVSIEYNTN
jgi:hypothetical protein